MPRSRMSPLSSGYLSATAHGRAESFTYGTTRATNAIVEGKTARTAFFTTQGFPDILLVTGRGQTGPLPANSLSAALRPAVPHL